MKVSESEHFKLLCTSLVILFVFTYGEVKVKMSYYAMQAASVREV
jgi:hypothetical protein